jgi:hypothetical protein
MVHAPGQIRLEKSGADIDAWPKGPYRVLITGLTGQPTVTWNGKAVEVEYIPQHGAAVVTVEGKGRLRVGQ